MAKSENVIYLKLFYIGVVKNVKVHVQRNAKEIKNILDSNNIISLLRHS